MANSTLPLCAMKYTNNNDSHELRHVWKELNRIFLFLPEDIFCAKYYYKSFIEFPDEADLLIIVNGCFLFGYQNWVLIILRYDIKRYGQIECYEVNKFALFRYSLVTFFVDSQTFVCFL